eukprot:4648408-Amphidinium_carterae.2
MVDEVVKDVVMMPVEKHGGINLLAAARLTSEQTLAAMHMPPLGSRPTVAGVAKSGSRTNASASVPTAWRTDRRRTAPEDTR